MAQNGAETSDTLGRSRRRSSYLGIGGTAAGSGLNAPTGYAEKVIGFLNEDLELDFQKSEDLFESMQSLAPFGAPYVITQESCS